MYRACRTECFILPNGRLGIYAQHGSLLPTVTAPFAQYAYIYCMPTEPSCMQAPQSVANHYCVVYTYSLHLK